MGHDPAQTLQPRSCQNHPSLRIHLPKLPLLLRCLLVNTVIQVPAVPLLLLHFFSASYYINSTIYTGSALFHLDPFAEADFGHLEVVGWLPTFEGHRAKPLAWRGRACAVRLNSYPAEHLALEIRWVQGQRASEILKLQK